MRFLKYIWEVGFAKGYSPATIFIDKELCFPQSNGPAYCPKNYDGKFHGVVTLRDSLGSSLNIPAVKMLKLSDEKIKAIRKALNLQ